MRLSPLLGGWRFIAPRIHASPRLWRALVPVSIPGMVERNGLVGTQGASDWTGEHCLLVSWQVERSVPVSASLVQEPTAIQQAGCPKQITEADIHASARSRLRAAPSASGARYRA